MARTSNSLWFGFSTRGWSSLLVAALAVVPVAQATAVPIQLTSGSIRMSVSSPAPLSDVFVELQGAGFSLDNLCCFLSDFFMFTGPEPGFVPEGTVLGFSGRATLISGLDHALVYGGNSYRASGTIDVFTSGAVVGPLLTLPFTLTGSIHGELLSGPGTVDLDLTGGGTMTATFTGPFPLEPPRWSFESLTYRIEPIGSEEPVPEPATLVLIGSGLLGLAARRRYARRNT